jgi:hypothetical protein
MFSVVGATGIGFNQPLREFDKLLSPHNGRTLIESHTKRVEVN